MLRRSAMRSQSFVERPCTSTAPPVGSSIPLIIRSKVVLPLPLRPSSISVSPDLTVRSIPDTSSRRPAPFSTRYDTPRKAIATARPFSEAVCMLVDHNHSRRKSHPPSSQLPKRPRPGATLPPKRPCCHPHFLVVLCPDGRYACYRQEREAIVPCLTT